MLSVSARPDAVLSPWVARDPPIPRLGSQLTVDAGSAPGDDEPEVIRFLQDPALTTHTDLYLSGLPKELRKELGLYCLYNMWTCGQVVEQRVIGQHRSSVAWLQVVPSAGTFFTKSYDGCLMEWSLSNWQCIRASPRGKVWNVAADARYLVVSTVDGRLEHWDPKSFAPLRSVRVVVQPQSRPQSLAISGSRIFSASADRVIAYDLESLEVLTELRDIQWGQLRATDDYLICGGYSEQQIEPSVAVWSMPGLRLLRILKCPGSIMCLEVVGNTLITGLSLGGIVFFDISSGTLQRVLRISESFSVYALHAYASLLVAGYGDHRVVVFDAEGRVMQDLLGHQGPVTCVQLVKGHILTGSTDHQVSVWRLKDAL